MKCSFFIFLCLSYSLFAQIDSNTVLNVTWNKIIEGYETAEIDAPFKSIINDSKLSLIKINPDYFEFKLLISSELNIKPLNVEQWADSFDLDIVFNAGMYDLSNKLKSKGFLKNHDYLNNSVIHPNYKTIFACNPKENDLKKAHIYDLDCNEWNGINNAYHCLAQGLRMLDCNGNPIGWNKRKQSCSMLLMSLDENDNLIFVFCRSPYTHNEMISFLKKMPFKLRNAIYLEGGPQTSFYSDFQTFQGDQFCLEKVGSYVSETYPTDKNNKFWKLPNVIGLKKIERF